MLVDQSQSQDVVAEALSELAHLRQFVGTPAEFWPQFLRHSANLTGANLAILALKSGEPASWKKMGQWPATVSGDGIAVAFQQQLVPLAESCSQKGNLAFCLDKSDAANGQNFSFAVRLSLAKGDEVCVAVFLVMGLTLSQPRDLLLRLQLIADVPASYQHSQAARQSVNDVEKFAATLDLLTQVNAEKRFLAAALALCNGLAARHGCDRVSLGWTQQGFIRLQAISRTEKFDRQMAAAKALEIAMEEALDQDTEILWPVPAGMSLVTRDHETYARDQGCQFLCSVPLRLDNQVVAVVAFERHTQAFNENELRQLRLSADQVVRRLADLKGSDRWFGARFMSQAREKLGQLVGVEHTWPKVIGCVVTLAILLLLVLRPTYRVEAKFILHSDELSYITAPFDGFIRSVPVRVSDPVAKQQPLLDLAKDELELEEAAALADLSRYSREAEKARAGNALADMRISSALANQAQARLEVVRYRLERATLRSPFDGIVVEGDQRERIGAPVKLGDVLFKVARTDTLYVEAEVNERDIHEISTNMTGQIAFASQPKFKFPVRLERVQPAAIPKEGENVFLVRAALPGEKEAWWRPGMTGVCKINVGRRNLIWILSHRTMDFLRLWLWW